MNQYLLGLIQAVVLRMFLKPHKFVFKILGFDYYKCVSQKYNIINDKKQILFTYIIFMYSFNILHDKYMEMHTYNCF